LVLHNSDWTYSLIFPPLHPWYQLKAVESYHRLHEWMLGAFGQIGVLAELKQSPNPEPRGQCFGAGGERFDLICEGRKVAGAAQRRTRHGLLIQGSIQPVDASKTAAWQKAVCDFAEARWGVRWAPFALDQTFEEDVSHLAKAKYETAAFNERR
jgi:lipoate-protein ligase A